MKTFSFITGILATGFILFNSCYPDGPESMSDYSMAGTVYDPAFDFSSRSTFIMPDTIVRIKTDKDEDKIYLTPGQQQEIQDYIRDQFVIRNWIDSTFNEDTSYIPDVYITISAIATKNAGYYWNYWGWYPGWGGWGGYPGYWYPWYPGGYPAYYQYSTGALILDMIDAKEMFTTSRDTIPFVWTAGMNGILSGSSIKTDNVLKGIDKVFELSPYLDK